MEMWNRFYENDALKALIQRQSGLGNLSLIEEAVLIASAYQKQPQTMCIVKANLYTAQRLCEKLTPLTTAKVLLFGVEDSLRMEAIAASPEMRAAQMETLSMLHQKEPVICITHTAGVMRCLCDPKQFQSHTLKLKTDETMDYEQLKTKLFEAGYEHVIRVDQPLCYAARGGIIDVYSMNYDAPIRIEFFDNIIESIRFFDISTQRTIQVADAVEIIPASEYLFTEDEITEIQVQGRKLLEKIKAEGKTQLFDSLHATLMQDMEELSHHRNNGSLYLYYAWIRHHYTLLDHMQDPFVIISSKEEVQNAQKQIQEETISYIQEMSKEGKAFAKFHVFADPFQSMMAYSHLCIDLFQDYRHPVSSQIIMHPLSDLPFTQIMDQLCEEAMERDILIVVSKQEAESVISYFKDHEITYRHLEHLNELPKGINLYYDTWNEGFVCLKEQLSVYTGKELFHTKAKQLRYANKFKEAEVLHDYTELNVGDYVVHHQHGVGKYLGIVNKEVEGIHKDFLHIAYRGNDVLLVPLEHFQFVRKFMSREGVAPKLNKLGSGEWEKTKKKVSGKIAEMADRLIALYALREEHIGYAFSADTPYQKQFEDGFAYELTADQARAVMEIKQDMERDKPMDRLLCGDVGFGKTEVAIRAAFKAIMDHKQVAFLCPTTILSLQHYHTFIERFREYPVRIEVLNRFVSVQKTKEVLRDLKAGKVDVLIGTHRILSKDVTFCDLGFLVIDEEQRFGVEHKEKIKELRSSVDVLSMTATPIPRTLQMSLVGIRALSQLNTPPLNRLPVQTYVIEKDLKIVKEIIQRELSRNGQVFYLFNNVNEIYRLANKLRKELPDVSIGVAHGKMNREEIEDVMLQFTNNEYQVLVCTTIIETGIDIPNANTIIIDNADRFGLSQLYQIKGRVGRSDRLAYAYLMVAADKQMSEVAMKRLTSIKEFTQLGSGYKIAMRDLTIRGAGDMLGAQQAGFIDTVGMDMYIEMLNEAIAQRKGEKRGNEEQEMKHEKKKANPKVDAYIPERFEQEDYEKIRLYQRMDALHDKQELLAFVEEIQDNYGHLPNAVSLLVEKKRLDILINEPHVEDFKELPQQLRLEFTQEWSDAVDGVKLFEMMTTLCRDALLRYTNHRIVLLLPKQRDWLALVIEVLERTQAPELKREKEAKKAS